MNELNLADKRLIGVGCSTQLRLRPTSTGQGSNLEAQTAFFQTFPATARLPLKKWKV
jgi:hypothetical protein